MKIRYKKKKWVVSLIIGSGWLVLGLGQLILNDFGGWLGYSWGVLGIVNFVFYINEYFNQYLTIGDGIIKVNSLFGKKINLNEIKRIKKFAGDYIIKTDTSELTISTQIIDPNSLTELNTELEKLDVKRN